MYFFLLYSNLKLYVLAIAATFLIIGIMYDDLKLKFMHNRRHNAENKNGT